jgi:alanine racemase
MFARLEIDTDAIAANLKTLAQLVAPARVAAVVKANAYGHGLQEVGVAIEHDVSRLCVYSLEEAIALRDASVDARIQVIGPVAPRDLPTAYASNVEITLWDDGSYAREVVKAATEARVPFPVHVKIDTGVTRLGFAADGARAAIERILAMPALRVAGVMSHLAAAEELDSTFTSEQLARFHGAVDGFDPAIERHIAASAAAMLWPQTRLDLVRAGIAIYGLWPSEPTRRIMEERGLHLVPALSWHTELCAVHDVPAETSVGYGCTYRTTRQSRIGVLPIGYNEGLPRARSNRGDVFVDGKRVPLVGRVCMNMAFVDVTDVPDAHIGSPVTLIGSEGDDRISAETFADWCDTINYELVARLPAAIPRRFAVLPARG